MNRCFSQLPTTRPIKNTRNCHLFTARLRQVTETTNGTSSSRRISCRCQHQQQTYQTIKEKIHGLTSLHNHHHRHHQYQMQRHVQQINRSKHSHSKRNKKKNASKRKRDVKSTTSSSSTITSPSTSTSKSPSNKFHNIISKLTPTLKFNMPGGNKEFVKEILKRLPFYMVLLYIVHDDSDYSPMPIVIDFMAGPSMLPTIHPAGDIYLRLRNSPIWLRRLLNYSTSGDNGNDNGNDNIQNYNITYNVGDIVIIKDYKGIHTCKRIIGVEGDVLSRYGQFSLELYSHEHDFGVREIHTSGSPTPSDPTQPITQVPSSSWEDTVEIVKKGTEETTQSNTKAALSTKIIIPKGHIWVEGDNPLHSIDSRHYGPIPYTNVRGKIIYRLWPRVRKVHGVGAVDADVNVNVDAISTCFISRNRPRPLTDDEMFNGPYNVFQVPQVDPNTSR